MKHTLLKTKSRLIMSLMIVIMGVVYTSCDDTETTDSTKFTIFYSGMTDIVAQLIKEIHLLTLL